MKRAGVNPLKCTFLITGTVSESKENSRGY